MSGGARYVRIGWVAECQDCDVELNGFWAVSKHEFLNHTWEGTKLQALLQRISRTQDTGNGLSKQVKND